MNNMIEKKLNEYREELEELSNNDVLFEYDFVCNEVEKFRRLTKDNPDNEHFQKRFDYERQAKVICEEECLKRMGGK